MHRNIRIMKGKKLIYMLYQLLKYVLYINIILAGVVLGFQIINIFSAEKSLITSYLGKFAVELNATGVFQTLQNNETAVFIDSISGMPSIAINMNQHLLLVLVFSIVVMGVTIFYNYKFFKIFEILNTSVKCETPFSNEISINLKGIAFFSLGVFGIGSILSFVKLWLIGDIVFMGFVARPVYDNYLLNFLWFGLGIYILNEIYKVGLELKNEQDLTI